MRERLYRSRSDRMLFGVAGGMARYLDLDASLVRIVWVLLVIAGGAGLLLYLIAAIVIPEEPEGGVAAAAAAAAAQTDASAATPGGPAAGAPGAPERTWGYRAGAERRDRGGGGAVIFGIGLVVLGGWLLLQRFRPQLPGDIFWPVVLVVLGGALVVGAMRRRG